MHRTQRFRSQVVDDAPAMARRIGERARAETAEAATATAIVVALLAGLAGWRLPI